MIHMTVDGIAMSLTLEELEPYVERLPRDALVRIVMHLSQRIRLLEEVVGETTPEVRV